VKTIPDGSVGTPLFNALTGNYEKKGNLLRFQASRLPKALENYEINCRTHFVCMLTTVSEYLFARQDIAKHAFNRSQEGACRN
jgi:hypothetical protein